VVTTEVGGVDEVVEAGVTGLVVPPERVDAVAAALTELAGDAERRRSMGERARRRVLDRYGVAACADNHAAAYAAAVARRDARRRPGAVRGDPR
jgi:glycosyltransferase involved in cell wall biosynthesis